MILRFLYITVLFTALSVFSTKAAFSYDAELAESSKCSRYFELYEELFHMPSNLLRAVAVTESGYYIKSVGRPQAWPWTINVEGKGYHYNSKREAVRAVQGFQAKGIKSIDIGCMQVNLRYHPEAFRNLEQAFEPKYNIGYAAQFLRSKYSQARNWKDAVGLYHNGVIALNRGYIQRVYNTWRVEDKSIQVAFLERPSISISDTPSTAQDVDITSITDDVLATFAR